MIDHVGLGVSDLEESKAFYQQALRPLGYHRPAQRCAASTASHHINPTPRTLCLCTHLLQIGERPRRRCRSG